MWKAAFGQIDPITKLAAAALLCSLLSQGLSSRQAELCSETLAWLILPTIFRIARQPEISKASRALLPGNDHPQPASAVSLWIVALGVAVFSIFQAEKRLIELFPALTPLLVAAQQHSTNSEFQASAKPESRLFSPFVDSIWGTTLVAAFTILTLSDWDLGGYALSAIPVAALLAVYFILTPRTGRSARYLPTFDIEHAIRPLSLRVIFPLIALLGAETVMFSFPRSNVFATCAQGVAKALTWYFVVQVIRESSWRTATTTGIFSVISTRDPVQHALSSGQPSSHVIAAVLTLGQLIHLLPKHAKVKSALWVFSFVSLVPYLANTLALQSAQSSLIHSQVHPIQVLTQRSQTHFEALLQRQSQNYTAAHREYKRRYGIEPPPGFEAWYNFAVSHQSPIIDEFDSISDAVAPFWKLSGKQVRHMMDQAHSHLDSELWLCTFSGAEARTQCSHRRRKVDRHVQFLFDTLLGDLPGVFPDVKFLVNHLDEPRVLIPPPSRGANTPQFDLTDLARQPAWENLTKFCFHKASTGRIPINPTAETFGLPFVTDRASAMDLCQHPEYSNMYGLAMSPTSLRVIQGLVPVLSTGSLSTMSDILYPSPAYLEPGFAYTPTHDPDWDQKQKNLYWAGSTTGAFARAAETETEPTWRSYHRQRFVELAQNLAPWAQHSYLHEKPDGSIHRVQSSFFNSRLFNVFFTRVFQCEPSQCRDQRMYFHTRPWADKDEPLRSRFVFDLDGNGISGRYYKLLASKSVPLKQTLLREWHDERLVPWVHYIPVSQGMEEVPEMVLYLTSSETGQKMAREIAEQGRKWYSRAFREVDMAVYLYRLLLELARIQDPSRPAS